MKKKIIFIVLIFSTLQVYSQSINYGIGVGGNSSKLISRENPELSPNYKIGFQLNAILKYNFSEKFGISVEPGFANRGAVWKSSDMKINLNYLILPIAANYTIYKRFSIFIGPECSYRISAKGKSGGENFSLNEIYNSKIDIGIIAGFSYQIIDNFNIGIRYNRGFISTIKNIRRLDEKGIDMGKADEVNQGFTFLVAYVIK